jgi:hypothetical protein
MLIKLSASCVLRGTVQKLIALYFLKCLQCYRFESAFTDHFKYLGHVITSDSYGDLDIQREMSNIFVRTNISAHKCHKYTIKVKRLLFKPY